MKNSTKGYLFNNEKEIEVFVGIETYSTGSSGIGGIYKHSFKDFIVKEITNKGIILQIKDYSTKPSISNDPKDKFTTFDLVKVNRDTFEAVRLISKALRVPVDLINYSGLKDKCSISVQQASVKGYHVEKLTKLNIRDIFIRNISQSKHSIKLGSNWGNNFAITIRNIEGGLNQKHVLDNLLQNLKNIGFPNYYGLQRFGTFRPNSHLVGRYLLEGDFKKAADELVLTLYSTESEMSRDARNELRNTGDYEKAYSYFPKSLNYERIIINHLRKFPNDYEGSINKLPPYLIKIIISSFQSYLFNKMLTFRSKTEESLFKPIKGDAISILDDTNGQITQTKYVYGNAYDSFLKEAIDLNRARIIIPLIGYDTNLEDFPHMKSLLLEILKQDKINLNIFENELLKKYEFKGSFRPILAKPVDLNLLEFEEDDIFPNNYKVKIEFSLQKGSYATMLLRELMK